MSTIVCIGGKSGNLVR